MANGLKRRSLVVNALLFIQLCNGASRYCKEAVDSVKIVESCPTSKKEWENAELMKNCSRIAFNQTCSPVEIFQYHCVINGYRNKTLEVCAPSRIIFGHCVEFNEPGGVIQDQLSAPCNETFPKCDTIYRSSSAYKYPDCYQLVFNRNAKHTFTTTANESTHTDGLNISMSTATEITPREEIHFLLIIATIFWVSAFSSIVLCVLCLIISYQRLGGERRTRIRRLMKALFKNNRQDIETKTTDGRRVMQTSLEQNHTEDTSNTKSDDPDRLQPDHTEDAINAKSDDPDRLHPDHREDAPKTQSADPGVLQSDSNCQCNSEVSTKAIHSATSSSDSTYYDAQEDRDLLTHFKDEEAYLHYLNDLI